MGRRAVSLALAATALGSSLFLYTRSLGVWGPILFFPFVGAPAVAGMMALRAALVRKLGGGPDPLARALEVIALGAMLAPGAGFLILTCSRSMEVHCGLLDARAATTALAVTWPWWGAGEGVVLVVLARRGSALARLRWYHAVATTLAILVAPPLALLAYVATCFENDHGGGAGVVVVLPAAIAAGSTVAAWTLGRSFATGTALRRLATAVLTLGVGLFLVLYRTPLPPTCVSFCTTATWGLLAEVGWAVAPCLAVVLYYARDPVCPIE